MNINDQINFRMDGGNTLFKGYVTHINVTEVNGHKLDATDLPCIMVRCEDESHWAVPVAWVVA
jgi:hypothetical protein